MDQSQGRTANILKLAAEKLKVRECCTTISKYSDNKEIVGFEKSSSIVSDLQRRPSLKMPQKIRKPQSLPFHHQIKFWLRI